MKFALVMVKPDGSMREFPFERDQVLIGRDAEAKLQIPLAAVSRRHCIIEVEDDELVAKDLGSSNGTYINGERLRSKETRELSPGDLLTVGGVVFVIKIDGYPARIDAKDCYAAGMVATDEPDFSMPANRAAPAGGGGKPLSPLGGKKSDDGFSDLLKDLEADDEEEK